MPSTEPTYYDIKRLHLWLAGAALMLLAVTVWMLLADYRRPWKQFQQTFRDQVEPSSTPSQLAQPLAIEQIWLPDLTIDYHFARVPRCDRCVTCHLGIDRSVGETGKRDAGRDMAQPYSAHPRLDLYLSAGSPHPMAEFGCTICHDGQGSATAFDWASHTPNDLAQRARWRQQYGWFENRHWDLPMLPGRFAESRCLKCHHQVTDLEPNKRFPDPPAAKLLDGYHLVSQLGCFGCHEIKGFDAAGRSVGPDMRLEPGEAPVAARSAADASLPPGTMRKVGRSLRDIADRVDEAFLADWIGDPKHFLPSARMPNIYGMYEQLVGQTRLDAQRLEAVEIRAVVAYLLGVSRSVEALPGPAGVSEPPSADRGKQLFEIHGCLACHKHKDFPAGEGIQGPELSRVGAKYTAAGAAWLTGWIRDPQHYAPRTRMPNSLLEPTSKATLLSADGPHPSPLPEGEGTATDPAADIAAYLLAGAGREQRPGSPAVVWQPRGVPPLIDADLDELALSYLSKIFPPALAQRYLREGIPASLAAEVPGDEAELLGRVSREKKLRYVGRRTIGKRGCFACHDIAGFESAQPIGPALSDWGRKQPSLLAFDQINQFVAQAAAADSATPTPAAAADRDFFREALLEHRREGFLWQKLRAPRSFDYQTAEQKPYNQWLTMGRFALTDPQREAIITFVLGLVAEPPAEKYLYRPDARRQAIVSGSKVLDKYACAACHTFTMERWTFEFDPAKFPAPQPVANYDFLKPNIPPAQLAASRKTDSRGLASAEVEGAPRVDSAGRIIEDEDDEGKPLCFFTPWEPAVINGHVWPVGGADVTIPKEQISRRRPSLGGAFARLLYPVVLRQARAEGFNGAESEAWGWVPPPLVHEGAAVQPAWLHEYLLQPYVIRPAAVLRMPRFNISSEEAGNLAEYFAAAAGVDFPFSADIAAKTASLRAPQRRLDEAERLLLDRTTYCAKCHLIGDRAPGGELRTVLAPNLDQAERRLRPQYLRHWLADPKSVLPYTPMPVNFPPSGEPLGQDLFPGSSLEQLDAVQDLLLNYKDYLLWRATSPRRAPPK